MTRGDGRLSVMHMSKHSLFSWCWNSQDHGWLSVMHIYKAFTFSQRLLSRSPSVARRLRCKDAESRDMLVQLKRRPQRKDIEHSATLNTELDPKRSRQADACGSGWQCSCTCCRSQETVKRRKNSLHHRRTQHNCEEASLWRVS